MISVCIVNWESTEYLLRCLDSIARDPPTRGVEIEVADNGTRGFKVAEIAALFPEVRWLLNAYNEGYARANNEAVSWTSGEYIMLLNPDTEVTSEALDRLAAFLDQHPEVAAVAPKLVLPDGRTQRSCRGFPDPCPLFWETMGLARLFPNRFGRYRLRDFDHESTRPVDQPMFSAVMIRREAWEQVAPLDERFPIFFNDVDWCMRAKEAGWQIWFLAEATVIHHHGQSTRHMGRALIRESHRSLIELYQKHYRSRTPAPLYAAMIASIRVSGALRTVLPRRH